jgi:hypothetical protein
LYRQGNHWKRYPVPEIGNGSTGKQNLESRTPELRRGKSDLCEQSREKSRDRDKNRDRVQEKLQQHESRSAINNSAGGSSRSHQGERSRRSQGICQGTFTCRN